MKENKPETLELITKEWTSSLSILIKEIKDEIKNIKIEMQEVKELVSDYQAYTWIKQLIESYEKTDDLDLKQKILEMMPSD